MDILTALLFQATLRKASILEQWLVNHRMHYPLPAIEISNDQLFERGRCSCGETLELTVLVNVVPKVIPGKWQAA